VVIVAQLHSLLKFIKHMSSMAYKLYLNKTVKKGKEGSRDRRIQDLGCPQQ
jgi:hypothetical protein